MAVISGDHDDDDSDMMTMMIRTPGGVPEGWECVAAALHGVAGRPGTGPALPGRAEYVVKTGSVHCIQNRDDYAAKVN